MGVFSDLYKSKQSPADGGQPSQPVGGGAFAQLYKGTPSPKFQAPPTQPPQVPIEPSGYGVSNLTDPTSGKPLLTYQNQAMQSSQLLANRTAPSFDFTKPQKITPDVLKNGRMPEDVSQSIKQSLGGTIKEQLDHIMPIEMGGSNTSANLRLEPTVKGVNTATDPIENQLTRQALNGDISVLDAWKGVAKAKGITLQEDQTPQQTQSAKQPSFWDNLVGGVKKAGSAFLSAVQQTQAGEEGLFRKGATAALETTAATHAAVTHPFEATMGAGTVLTDFGLGVSRGITAGAAKVGIPGADQANKWLTENQPALNELFQQTYAGTPDTKTAFITGHVVGSVLPYYLTGELVGAGAEAAGAPLLSNFGGTLTPKTVETIGRVMKEASDVTSFFGTGQITHTPDQGSRWNQFLSDAVTYGVFKGTGLLYSQFKGDMPFSTAEEKMAAIRQQAKNEAIDTLNSYLPKDQKIAYDATDAEIKNGYKSAAHLNHPDLGGKTEDMVKINKAMAYLNSVVEKPPEAPPEVPQAPRELPGEIKPPETPTEAAIVPAEKPSSGITVARGGSLEDIFAATRKPGMPGGTLPPEVSKPVETLPSNIHPLLKVQPTDLAKYYSGLLKPQDYPEIQKQIDYIKSRPDLMQIAKEHQEASDQYISSKKYRALLSAIKKDNPGILKGVNRDTLVVALDNLHPNTSRIITESRRTLPSSDKVIEAVSPSNLFEDVPPHIEEAAQKDWEDNYADKIDEIQSEFNDLKKQIKDKAMNLNVKDQLRARMAELDRQSAAIENQFVEKWRGEITKEKGVAPEPVRYTPTGKALPTAEDTAKIEQLKQHIEAINEAIREIPASKLWKYADKTNRELPEMTGEKARGIFRQRGDQFLSELYGRPVDEQTVLKDFESVNRLRDERNKLEDILKSGDLSSVKLPEEQPAETGDTTLFSGFDPGLDKFLNEDVKPGLQGAGEGFIRFLKETVNFFSPKSFVDPKVIDTLFKMKGAMQKAMSMMDLTVAKAESGMNKMPIKDLVDFFDRRGAGLAQKTPELQAVAEFIDEVYKKLADALLEYKPDMNIRENYIGMRWKVVPGKPEAKGFMGLFRRPLRGTMTFTKPAFFTSMSEGIKAGGVPITYNPITMMRIIYEDGMKFITANKMWEELGNTNQRQWLQWENKMPVGFTELQDKIKNTLKQEAPSGAGPGRWVVNEGAGRLLNNTLSKDWIRSNAFGRGMMWVKNATTAIELSLSPFHFVFVSLDTMASGMAIGIRKTWNLGLARGNIKMIGEGLKDIITSPAAPVKFLYQGRKFLSAIKSPDEFFASDYGKNLLKVFPEARQFVDDLFTAGALTKMSHDYEANTAITFLQNLNSGNYIGAVLRALPALNKTLMYPLFQVYIPGIKMGMFLNEFPLRLLEKADDLASGKVTRETLARQTWALIEDRLGEMNFDNIMWNRTLKAVLQLGFRSVTWKFGNIHLLGIAGTTQVKELISAAKEGRAPDVTPAAANIFSIIAYTVIFSTIIMKTMTGKYPQTVKDAFYPQIDPKDPTKRISIPTYTRDYFSLAHSPTGYFKSSLTSEWGRLYDLTQNADFYNTEIYNTKDPLYKQMYQAATYVVPLPFSVQNALRPGNTPAMTAAGFLGLTKAPAYISQTPIQQSIFGLYQTRFGGGVQTQESAAQSQAKTDIRNAYIQGDTQKANDLLNEAIKKGYIKPRGVDTFIREADIPGDVRAFNRLDAADQESLLKKMDVQELQRYAWNANSAVKEHFSTLSPDTKMFVDELNAGKIKAPIWKKGQPQ